MKIIVGKTAGFCYGVKRAINGSIEQLENSKYSKIYCLGELVHNKQVTKNLENKGIEFIDDIKDVKSDNSKLIFRAHGVEKQIYEYANSNNIDFVDFTCPNVLKIHNIAEDFEKKGYYIFLTGTPNHPEVVGITSYCGKNFSLITEKEDINNAMANFKNSNLKKLLLISQTTYSVNLFTEISNTIKNIISQDVELIIKNTICSATELRQQETKDLSQKVDAMIIIGGKHSSNTKKLFDLASIYCKNTILVETKDELQKSFFDNIDVLGIMAGASTPQESIDEVVAFLK